MSGTFKSDLELESIIGNWLDENLYSNKEIFNNYKRHKNQALQHKGVDLTLSSPVLFGDTRTHVIDEKAAIRYTKGNLSEKSLQSFAFELDYFVGKDLKEGWLFGNKYSKTEYYIVLWIWADIPEKQSGNYKMYDSKKITKENILKVEGVLLSKEAMRNYALLKKVSPLHFEELREKSVTEKVLFDDNAKIVVSNQLSEKPMNLIVPKEVLKEFATCHFIQEKGKQTKILKISDNNYSELIIKNNINDIEKFTDEVIRKTKKGTKIFIFSKRIEEIEKLLKSKLGLDDFNLATKDAALLGFHKLSDNSMLSDAKYTNGNISSELKNEKKFNWSQFEIEHTDINSNIKVTAGAGTGKTRTMLQRIMFNLNTENELKFKDIAMVTFTNDAADEMKAKLRALLLARFKYTKSKKYLHLLESSAEITVKTIDSFSKDVIKSLGYREGYGQGVKITSMKYRRHEILREVINRSFTTEISNIMEASKERYYVIIDYIDNMWQELLSKGFSADKLLDYELNSDFDKTIVSIINEANKVLAIEKKENDLLEMSDLKFHSESLVEVNDEEINLNINYKYIFIDEFQDTDDLQISLFVKLQKLLDARLFIVGDKKQAIYRFRGSDNTAFKLIEKEIEFEAFEMSINYRTDEKLLESMSHYFNKMQGLSSNSLVSFINPQKNHSVNLVEYNDSEYNNQFLEIFKEYATLTKEENDVLKSDKKEKKSILAVLCRQNYQVDEICQLLDNNGYKGQYQTSKLGELFQSRAAMDLFGFISVLVYSTNEQYKYFATTTPYFYNQQSMNSSINNWNSNRSFFTETQNDSLNEMLKESRIMPFLSIIRKIILKDSFAINIRSRLYQEGVENDVDITRIQEEYFLDLNDILEQMAKNFGTGTYSLIDIYSWLEIKIKTDTNTGKSDTSSSEANIIITTIHKSKGLEYERVILPKTADIIYVRPKSLIIKDDKSTFAMNLLKGDAQSDNYKELKEIEQTELKKDETRLLYVGMTRAKQELSILIPSKVKNYLSIAKIIEEAK